MKRVVVVICITLSLAFVCMSALGCAAVGYTVFSGESCFSDSILFSAKIMGGRASYAHERMKKVIAEIDRAASLTRADSDVSRFNRAAAGERVQVSAHVYKMFELGAEYYTLTSGAFNIAAAPLCELWGVDAHSLSLNSPDLDGAYPIVPPPGFNEVAEALEYCDPTTVTAQAAGGKYYLTKADGRTKLDLGGIAKGYAVDECVRLLGEYDVTSALIDISGNAYFYGRYIDGGKASNWHVGVVSPRPRGGQIVSRGYVCALSLAGDISAVTSGDYMRYRIFDGENGKKLYIPHIIGEPGAPIGVQPDGEGWKNSEEWVISATVVGESSAVCDMLSTAVCAMGLERGAEFLAKSSYKGLIFTEKRYTIIGDIALYAADKYDGYKEYGVYAP